MKLNLEDLEAYYEKSLYVKEMCIFLSQSPQGQDCLTALILPDFEYCASQGVSQIKDRMHWEIQKLSRGLPVENRVKKYVLIKDPLPRTALGEIKRFEAQQLYLEKTALFTESRLDNNLSPEDNALLASPLRRQALEYLSQKLKRRVRLDDHLELDLGLDSLERVGLFFEFQHISGAQMEEKDFFFISTVRDVLTKLRTAPHTIASKDENTSWDKIVRGAPDEKIRKTLTSRQTFLSNVVNAAFFLLLSALTRLFFRIKVKGRSNLSEKGPYILCPNHSSYLDVPLIIASIGFSRLRNTFFLGYSAYLNHLFIRWAKRLFRLVPVDPGSRLAETLAVCGFVLKNSGMLCMFPEGIRSYDGEIHEFKRGIGILIKELQVDVVPVYIHGAYQAWPPYKIFPSFGRIQITFGEKLSPEELASGTIENIDAYQIIADNLKKKLIDLKEDKP